MLLLMFLLLFLEVITLWIWASSDRIGIAADLELAAALRRVAAHGRTGAIDWRTSDLEHIEKQGDLVAAIDDVWRAGLPIGDSFLTLAGEVDRAVELRRSCQNLRCLLIGRLALALAAGGLGRFILDHGRSQNSDVLAFTAAGIVAALAQIALRRLLPQPWVGAQLLSPLAIGWWKAYATGVSVPGGPCEQGLAYLDARELLIGVSLRDEKRRLLVEWAGAQLAQGRQSLQRITEALPLSELVGIGIPVALILLPILKPFDG